MAGPVAAMSVTIAVRTEVIFVEKTGIFTITTIYPIIMILMAIGGIGPRIKKTIMVAKLIQTFGLEIMIVTTVGPSALTVRFRLTIDCGMAGLTAISIPAVVTTTLTFSLVRLKPST